MTEITASIRDDGDSIRQELSSQEVVDEDDLSRHHEQVEDLARKKSVGVLVELPGVVD